MVNDQPALLKVINKTPAQKVYEQATTEQGALAAKLNARKDIDTVHDFVFWEAKDSVINDYSAFNDLKSGNWARYNRLNQQVQANLKEKASFLGDKSFDYDNMSPADAFYYQDFLGFIKKAVNSVGHAATSVAHGVRSVAESTAHGVRDVAVGAAHDVRNIADDAGHAATGLAHDAVKLHNAQDKEIDKVLKDVGHGVEGGLKAVAPYWKVLATAAIVTGLALTGVGLPLALSIGAAALTGLDSIKPEVPYLAPEAGDGGGGDDEGDDMDDQGGDDSPNDQSKPYDAQAAAQAQADAEAEQAAAAHKKRLIYIGLGVVSVIVIIWFIRKKK